jgi:hypothetical protein
VDFFGFWLFEIPLAYCLSIPLQRSFVFHRHRRDGHGGRQRNLIYAGEVEEAEDLVLSKARVATCPATSDIFRQLTCSVVLPNAGLSTDKRRILQEVTGPTASVS